MLAGEQIRQAVETFDDQIFFHSSSRFVEVLSGKTDGKPLEFKRKRQRAQPAESLVANEAPQASPARGRELAEEKRKAAIARRTEEEDAAPAPRSTRRRGG